jgi:hypothetical protein
MNKYHAKKTCYNGVTYDSKREAERAWELDLLQRAGEISDLKRQVPFELIPKQAGERAVIYKADFTYRDKAGRLIVEDVKGQRLPEYVLKRKLMLWVHGIRIQEV